MIAELNSRPNSVKLATCLLWLALAIGFSVAAVQAWNSALNASPASLIATYAFTFGVGAFFVYLVWRGLNWARITYLVFTLLGTFISVREIVAKMEVEPVVSTVTALNIVIQLFAMYLLFTQPGKAWFSSESRQTG